MQNPVQSAAELPRKGSHDGEQPEPRKAVFGSGRNNAANCEDNESHRLGVTGLERGDVTGSENKDLQNPSESSGAESGAVLPETAPVDPDLAKVIDAWPDLPEAVKAGISAMVSAAQGSAKGKTDGANG